MRMSEIFKKLSELSVKPLDTIVIETRGHAVVPFVVCQYGDSGDDRILKIVRLSGHSLTFSSDVNRDMALPYTTIRRWSPEQPETKAYVERIRYDLIHDTNEYVR